MFTKGMRVLRKDTSKDTRFSQHKYCGLKGTVLEWPVQRYRWQLGQTLSHVYVEYDKAPKGGQKRTYVFPENLIPLDTE